jgi:hypothetical protein
MRFANVDRSNWSIDTGRTTASVSFAHMTLVRRSSPTLRLCKNFPSSADVVIGAGVVFVQLASRYFTSMPCPATNP